MMNVQSIGMILLIIINLNFKGDYFEVYAFENLYFMENRVGKVSL